jgi:hypothetical protein
MPNKSLSVRCTPELIAKINETSKTLNCGTAEAIRSQLEKSYGDGGVITSVSAPNSKLSVKTLGMGLLGVGVGIWSYDRILDTISPDNPNRKLTAGIMSALIGFSVFAVGVQALK